jgi:hypothetical protein
MTAPLVKIKSLNTVSIYSQVPQRRKRGWRRSRPGDSLTIRSLSSRLAFKEKQITESVISKIEGDNGDTRCVAGGIPFRNLDHLTDGTLVPGNPDRYYGARPEQLDRRLRSELEQ